MSSPAPTASPPRRAIAGFDDPVGRAAVRSMKRRATGLLLATAALFLATFAMPDDGWVGFVRAATEAGMVGGLADWFAVTALFRHPLGIPIPHTALVPKQKDALAAKLGSFVAGNFVTPDAVAEQVRDTRLLDRAASYAADPAKAAAMAKWSLAPLAAALESVEPAAVTEVALDVLRKDLSRRQTEGRSWAPLMGEFLEAAVEGRAQQPLVDVLVETAREHLASNRDQWHAVVQRFLDEYGLIGRLIATERRVDKILDHVLDTLAEVHRDGRSHPLRRSLDEALAKLARELRTNPKHAAAIDAQLRLWAYDPRMEVQLHKVVVDVLESARASLSSGDGVLEARLAEGISRFGRRLRDDAEFAARAGQLLDGAIRWTVAEYGDQLVTLIRTQVEAWDARDASGRIETAVGRDLQFIRINGTVVGALAGVVIHAVALLVERL
ncbi:MAG: DUF445 domain-containing protein [Sporichthyaceae bacterium]